MTITFQDLIKQAQVGFSVLSKSGLVVELTGDTFQDDRITCCNVTINGVLLTLMWCGDEIIGDIKYMSDSSKAFDNVCKFFHIRMDVWLEELIDKQASDIDIINTNEYKFMMMCGVVENDYKIVTF